MKKIIVIICLLLCIVNINTMNAVGENTLTITGDVEGYLNQTIETQTVTISVNSDCGYVFDVDKFTGDQNSLNITDWFKQPDGYLGDEFNEISLGLTAIASASVDSNELTVTFSGSYLNDDDVYTDEVGEKDICAYIPIGYIYYMNGVNKEYNTEIIQLPINCDAQYIIKDFAIRYKQDYTVSGYVGEEIEPQIIEIEIYEGEESIDELMALNYELPEVNGLTPTITGVSSNGKEITITYTGTPLETSEDLIHTTLDADLFDHQDDDVVVEDRDDVKFSIVERYVYEWQPPEFVIPKTGI